MHYRRNFHLSRLFRLSLITCIHIISTLRSVILYSGLVFNGEVDANALFSHSLDFRVFCIADYTTFLLRDFC